MTEPPSHDAKPSTEKNSDDNSRKHKHLHWQPPSRMLWNLSTKAYRSDIVRYLVKEPKGLHTKTPLKRHQDNTDKLFLSYECTGQVVCWVFLRTVCIQVKWQCCWLHVFCFFVAFACNYWVAGWVLLYVWRIV